MFSVRFFTLCTVWRAVFVCLCPDVEVKMIAPCCWRGCVTAAWLPRVPFYLTNLLLYNPRFHFIFTASTHIAQQQQQHSQWAPQTNPKQPSHLTMICSLSRQQQQQQQNTLDKMYVMSMSVARAGRDKLKVHLSLSLSLSREEGKKEEGRGKRPVPVLLCLLLAVI